MKNKINIENQVKEIKESTYKPNARKELETGLDELGLMESVKKEFHLHFSETTTKPVKSINKELVEFLVEENLGESTLLKNMQNVKQTNQHICNRHH